MGSELLSPDTALHREQGRYALVAGYIAIWLLMTLLSAAALGYMASIQQQLHDIVEIHNNKKDLVKRMHESMRERTFSLQQMLLADDPFERESEITNLYQSGSLHLAAREQYLKLPLDQTEQNIVSGYRESTQRGAQAQNEILTLIESGNTELARQVLLMDMVPVQQKALARLKDLEDYHEANIRIAFRDGESSYENARVLLIVLGGFAVFLLLVIAIKVFRIMSASSQALHDEKERLRITLHSIGDGVISTDRHGIVDYINPIAEKFTGWNRDKAKGTGAFDVFHVINAADGKPVASAFSDLVDESRASDLHHHSLLMRRDGTTIAVDYTASAIHHNDGSIGGYVAVFRDESKLREMAHHLSHQATHDQLTNLANRREFERRVELLLKQAKAHHNEHVLCYLDLDRFKIINDSCGHAAGDELLKQVVNLFRQQVRSNDLLARIGGDEFGLLLENCPVERALGITEEIRKSTHLYRFAWNGQTFQIGVSIGLVAIDNRWKNLPELLAAADAACYAAKDGGRNRIHLYLNSSTSPEDVDEGSWPARIRVALEQERLIHYYQRPVSLQPSTSDVHYVDLQLRILEQGRQRLPLTPLLPHAERHGLAPLIDRWAVEHALMLALLRENCNAVYTISLSAASLQDAHFMSDIESMAGRYSAQAKQLCLELPECSLIANAYKSSQTALALKASGFHIALNGTGQSIGTIEALRSIPFDYLRISGDFIHEAMDDPILHIQLEAIVRMAHGMGMRVIAMDIQSRQMIEQLDEIGVDFISGHGIAKQRPAIALLISDLPEDVYASKRA